jgi:hypothetical protein
VVIPTFGQGKSLQSQLILNCIVMSCKPCKNKLKLVCKRL